MNLRECNLYNFVIVSKLDNSVCSSLIRGTQ